MAIFALKCRVKEVKITTSSGDPKSLFYVEYKNGLFSKWQSVTVFNSEKPSSPLLREFKTLEDARKWIARERELSTPRQIIYHKEKESPYDGGW